MPRLPYLLLIVTLSLGSPSAFAGDEQVPFMYFSYEQAGVDGQSTYALVPRTGMAPEGLPWADMQKFAFELLKKAKAPTYGATSIYVNPDRTVTVTLDDTKKPYYPIVVGEVVYTLVGLGAVSLSFPALGSKPFTRADVDVLAFVPVLPLWRALPPQPLPVGLVRMDDGSLVPSSKIKEWIDGKAQALVDHAAKLLESKDDQKVRAGLACLNHLKVPNLPDLVMGLMEHPNADIRLFVVGTMRGTDDPAKLEALAEVVQKEKDQRIASLAAEILRDSGKPEFASYGLFYVLNGKDMDAAVEAAKKLGDMKVQVAVPQLARAARSKNEKLRMAAVEAIAKIGDTNVLKDLLGFPDIPKDVKIKAARILASLKDQAKARNGLVFLLLNGKGEDSASAATRLGDTKDPQVVPWLIQALDHPEAKTRLAAARALGKLADPRALAPLAKAASKYPKDSAVLSEQVIGIMAAQSFDSTLKLAGETNLDIRKLATESLGHQVRKNPKVAARALPVLAERINDPSPAIRRAAVNALGIMGGNKKALPLILKLKSDPNPGVRAAVAAALGTYKTPDGTKELVALIDDEEDSVRIKAIESCKIRREEAAVTHLINYRSHRNPEIKRLVIQTLAEINPPKLHKTLREVFSEAVFDQDPEVRLASVKGLKEIKDPRVLDIMSVLLQDPDERVKMATLRAYGETGFPQALEPLLAALQTETDPDVKVAALDGVLALKAKKAVPSLQKLKDKEPDKKVEARYVEVIAKLKAIK